MILPVVRDEYAAMLEAFARAEKCCVSSGTTALKESIVELGSGLDSLKAEIAKLDDAVSSGKSVDILAAMGSLRTTVDSLEHHVPDDKWPLPKYRDMLFLY